MRFSYRRLLTLKPVYPLGGVSARYKPILTATIASPLGNWASACLVDSGADDTVFPDTIAHQLGIDLSGAPEGESFQAAGQPVTYRYAPVRFHLSDGMETCDWDAIVGFVAAAMRWPLLGHAGFLQFFDVTFLGHAQELILAPNPSFSGQHTVP
jgi:hypothetical protein